MATLRKLFVGISLFSSTLVYSQAIGIKTNMLMDFTKTISLGAEVGLDNRSTIDFNIGYRPWKNSRTKMFKLLLFQPEYRYWLCERFNGHFIGAHLHAGVYQVAGIDMPFGLWDQLKENRFKGHFYGLGVSYGYQWILGKHWNLEGNIGLGYIRAQYKKYPCVECGELEDKGHKNYFGPTKAAVSLIYLF
ncbi:MAG: DUF3575 domain-containing protein [Tannerellaceae bacterium]